MDLAYSRSTGVLRATFSGDEMWSWGEAVSEEELYGLGWPAPHEHQLEPVEVLAPIIDTGVVLYIQGHDIVRTNPPWVYERYWWAAWLTQLVAAMQERAIRAQVAFRSPNESVGVSRASGDVRVTWTGAEVDHWLGTARATEAAYRYLNHERRHGMTVVFGPAGDSEPARTWRMRLADGWPPERILAAVGPRPEPDWDASLLPIGPAGPPFRRIYDADVWYSALSQMAGHAVDAHEESQMPASNPGRAVLAARLRR